MSEYDVIFAGVALICGVVGVVLAVIISAEEDIHERFYGNDKETGFKDK